MKSRNSVLFALAAIFMLNSLFAQSENKPNNRTIVVTGKAEMDVIPNEVFLQVDLKEYKRGNNKVDLETIKRFFLSNCTRLGLTENDISINAMDGADFNFNYWIKKRKTPDMYASISYWIKFSDSKLMASFVADLDDQATQRFFIVKKNHTQLETFKKELSVKAIQTAKERARVLCEAIGEKLNGALTITPRDAFENISALTSRMVRMDSNGAGVEEENIPNVDFKKISIRSEVEVVFLLK